MGPTDKEGRHHDQNDPTQGFRFASNAPHHRHTGQHASITNVILELGWEHLAERKRKNRLTFPYKITNDLVEVPQMYNIQLPRGNQQSYQRPSSEVKAFANSFLVRTIDRSNHVS